MSDLRSQLEKIVTDFVGAVISAMKSASLDDLASQAGGTRGAPRGATAKAAKPAGRRSRASAEEVQALKDLALKAAKTLPAGFKKADVMMKSGSKEDLGRALTLLVKDGKLTKKGARRETRYWVK